jgi:hypothetical protein
VADAVVSRRVQRVQMVMIALTSFVVGLTVGLLLRPVPAGRFEAVGTWVGALVGMTALILAVLAFRWSEDFMRLMEHSRREQAEDHAKRLEHARLQREADRVVCQARYIGGTVSREPGMVLAEDIEVQASNNSSQAISEVYWRMPQLGGGWFWLSDVIAPGQREGRRLTASFPFKAREDQRELNRDAEFTFSLGGVRWSAQYGRPIAPVDPEVLRNH